MENKIKNLKLKLNGKKIMGVIKYILIIAMIIFIYIISPKITGVIQNIARYLYEIDDTYITRIVELVLAVSLVLPSILVKDNEEEK